MRKILIVGFVLGVLLGCGKEEPVIVSSQYSDGGFIMNQGKFGDGTGTVTYFDRDTTIIHDVYQIENAGTVLGNVAQSMIEVDGKILMAINNAAKVEIVQASDFMSVATIGDVAQARFFVAPGNGFTYLSAWGDDGFSGAIHKIDLSDNTLVNSLDVGGGPENMVAVSDELYIAKSGGFGTDSTVLIYDLSNDIITNSIIVGDNPVGIVKTDNNEIYVLCTGAFDFVDPANSTSGSLYKIIDNNASMLVELANGSNNLCLDSNTNTLYYLDASGIQSYNINTGNFRNVASGFYYALAFDTQQSYLYAGDAKDFASNGEVIVLDVSGAEIRKISAGIVPGHIYFGD